MAENNSSKIIDTIIDFAIIVSISFLIFISLTYIGAPMWLALIVVALWGAYTGYKPKIVRKILPFLYKKED